MLVAPLSPGLSPRKPATEMAQGQRRPGLAGSAHPEGTCGTRRALGCLPLLTPPPGRRAVHASWGRWANEEMPLQLVSTTPPQPAFCLHLQTFPRGGGAWSKGLTSLQPGAALQGDKNDTNDSNNNIGLAKKFICFFPCTMALVALSCL